MKPLPLKLWTRTIVLLLITAAFVGLAVAVPANGGPWLISLAYLVCGGVTFTVAVKVRPAPDATTPNPAADAARQARRSGNPARRAAPRRGDDH